MPTTEIILLALLASFLFGFTLDFADLLDEHGLKWFPGAALLFGFLEGITGAAVLLIYPAATIFIFSLVLYWLVVGKIDYINHKIGAGIVFLATLFQTTLEPLNFLHVAAYVVSYLIITWGYQFLKGKYGRITLAPVRHYIPTILLSVLTGNPWLIAINFACTVGVYLSDWWFKRFEKKTSSNMPNRLGLYIASGTQ